MKQIFAYFFLRKNDPLTRLNENQNACRSRNPEKKGEIVD